MSKDTSGPAFPQPITGTIDGHILTTCEKDNAQSGVTMRDWFAGKALQGLMMEPRMWNPPEGKDFAEHFSEQSYALADAMLIARDV